jgi:hypothetical protein
MTEDFIIPSLQHSSVPPSIQKRLSSSFFFSGAVSYSNVIEELLKPFVLGRLQLQPNCSLAFYFLMVMFMTQTTSRSMSFEDIS